MKFYDNNNLLNSTRSLMNIHANERLQEAANRIEGEKLIHNGYRGLEVLFTKDGYVSGFIHDDKEILLRKARFPSHIELVETLSGKDAIIKANNIFRGNVDSTYPDVYEAKALIDEYLNTSIRLDDKFRKFMFNKHEKLRVLSNAFNLEKKTTPSTRNAVQFTKYAALWAQYKNIVKDFYTTNINKRKNEEVIVKDLKHDNGIVGYAIVLPKIKNKNKRLISNSSDHPVDIHRFRKGFKFKFNAGIKRKMPLLIVQEHPSKGVVIVPPKRGKYVRSQFSSSMDVEEAILKDGLAKFQKRGMAKDKRKIEKEHMLYGDSNSVIPKERRTTYVGDTEPIFEEDEGYLRDYYNYIKDIDDNEQ